MLQLYHMQWIETMRRYVPHATQYLLLLLIVSIPFSVRYLFSSTWNFQTGAYSDFTSISIYMSDLVIVAIFIFFIFSLKRFYISNTLPKFWLYVSCGAIGWLALELFLNLQNPDLPLQRYFTLRFIVLIVLAYIISQIRVSREKIAIIFISLGVMQSLIAIYQFYLQKSVGLYFLGESHLDPNTLGIAKIVSHGTKLIRAYGTFPHPNLLSAFLVIALSFNLYLIAIYYQIPRGKWLYIPLALNIFGLFLTLSRGGILALVVALALLSINLIIKKQFDTFKRLIVPPVTLIFISAIILFPYLSTRTTITDNSTKERLFYDQIGEKIISNKPYIGIGPGTSVLHMEQYSEEKLEPWQIQPIHNYFLISWAEWGIGSILLLLAIIYPICLLFMRKFELWELILGSIGVSLLFLFLLDHYFYTIWPTQVLLWVIIGFMLREITYDKLSD
jgi:hypothetical protein